MADISHLSTPWMRITSPLLKLQHAQAAMNRSGLNDDTAARRHTR